MDNQNSKQGGSKPLNEGVHKKPKPLNTKPLVKPPSQIKKK